MAEGKKDRADQAWASDITYIPMKKEFRYLTVIMDWHTRCELSWRLLISMGPSLCTEALGDALFIKRLLAKGISLSMDGKGRYLDNIFVERFWRNRKHEEVYLHSYDSPEEAGQKIGNYISFYNFERLHQSLGYPTTAEAYANSKSKQSKSTTGEPVPYMVSLIVDDTIAENYLINQYFGPKSWVYLKARAANFAQLVKLSIIPLLNTW